MTQVVSDGRLRNVSLSYNWSSGNGPLTTRLFAPDCLCFDKTNNSTEGGNLTKILRDDTGGNAINSDDAHSGENDTVKVFKTSHGIPDDHILAQGYISLTKRTEGTKGDISNINNDTSNLELTFSGYDVSNIKTLEIICSARIIESYQSTFRKPQKYDYMQTTRGQPIDKGRVIYRTCVPISKATTPGSKSRPNGYHEKIANVRLKFCSNVRKTELLVFAIVIHPVTNVACDDDMANAIKGDTIQIQGEQVSVEDSSEQKGKAKQTGVRRTTMDSMLGFNMNSRGAETMNSRGAGIMGSSATHCCFICSSIFSRRSAFMARPSYIPAIFEARL